MIASNPLHLLPAQAWDSTRSSAFAAIENIPPSWRSWHDIAAFVLGWSSSVRYRSILPAGILTRHLMQKLLFSW